MLLRAGYYQFRAQYFKHFTMGSKFSTEVFIKEPSGVFYIHATIKHEEVVLITNCLAIPIIGGVHDNPYFMELFRGQIPDNLGGLTARQVVFDGELPILQSHFCNRYPLLVLEGSSYFILEDFSSELDLGTEPP